jgi:hypothetical protein
MRHVQHSRPTCSPPTSQLAEVSRYVYVRVSTEVRIFTTATLFRSNASTYVHPVLRREARGDNTLQHTLRTHPVYRRVLQLTCEPYLGLHLLSQGLHRAPPRHRPWRRAEAAVPGSQGPLANPCCLARPMRAPPGHRPRASWPLVPGLAEVYDPPAPRLTKQCAELRLGHAPRAWMIE